MLLHRNRWVRTLLVVFIIHVAGGTPVLAPVEAAPHMRGSLKPEESTAVVEGGVRLPAKAEPRATENGAAPADETTFARSMTDSGMPVDERTDGEALRPVPELRVFTGAASYRYPIDVPPGRNGMQPDLTLTYNHYLRNGPMGVGWILNLGAIQRSTKFGLDYHQNDRFEFAQDDTTTELVARSTAWGEGYFGARVETLFTKYYFDQARDTWTATTRAGTRLYFGRQASSRQTNPHGTFKWHLDKIQDANDNFLEITYIEDNGQQLISRIDYAAWERDGYPAVASTHAVKFYYAPRTDIWVQYTSKAYVATTQRLVGIETYADGQLARVYRLAYEVSPTTLRSRLKSIQIEGADAWSVLPPTTFTYNNSFFGTFGEGNSTSFDRRWSGPRPAEIDRDGFVDLIAFSDYRAYGLTSNGDGTFTVPSHYFAEIVRPRRFADFNGDGYSDVLGDGRNGDAYVRLSNGDGAFGGDAILTLAPGVYKEYGEWLTAELNGDFLRDIIYYDGEGKSYLFYSNGDGTFTAPTTNCWPCRPDYVDLRPQLLADVNDDGLTDSISYAFSQFSGGKLSVKLSQGDGSFGVSRVTPVNARILYMYDFEHRGHFTAAEVNGDGLTDVIYSGDGKMYYFLSKGDGTFTSPGPTEPWTGIAGCMVDVNNDGFSDLLRQTASMFDTYLSCRLSINGGQPDALVQVATQSGASATIAYQSAAQSLGSDLPFSLYAVTSITIDDGLGDTTETESNHATTRYTYENGSYDYNRREFRGYAAVQRTNPDGSINHFHFLQGPFNRGKPDHIELTGANQTFTIETTQFEWQEIPLGARSMFVALQSERTTYYDHPIVWIDNHYTYDQRNGLVTATVTSGTDADGNPAAYNLLTETRYSDEGQWTWRLTEERKKYQGDGLPARHTKHHYSATQGNLLATEFIQYPDGAIPEVHSTVRYGYDLYGNTAWREDAEEHRTDIHYDPISHTFPQKIVSPEVGCDDQGNCTRHIVELLFDTRFGKQIAHSDENGFWTYYRYDPFGRLEQVEFPDGGRKTIVYHDDVFPRQRIVEVLENAATATTIDTRQFYDGLDRMVQMVRFGENGKAIARKVQYDAMGRVKQEIGPFFASGQDWEQSPPAAHHFLEFDYDERSRIKSVYAPHGQHLEGGVVTRYAYGGFTTRITDPDGSRKDERRDFLGNIREVIEYNDGEPYTTSYTYNAAGDLLTVTDPLQNTTFLTYDTLGRKTTQQDPDMGFWQYRYDKNGNLIWQKDARLNEIEWRYDALNRMTHKIYLTTSDHAVHYTYDAAANGVGKPYAIDNADVRIEYTTYDEMGRLTAFSKAVTGASQPHTIQIDYDLSGKVVRRIFDKGVFANAYVYYPGACLLDRVTDAGGVTVAKCSDYQPTGSIGRIDYLNHAMTVFGYDALSTKLLYVATAVNAYWRWVNVYHYTPAGDIATRYDWITGTQYSYTYDSLHRLVSEISDADAPPLGYGYDATGNMVMKTVGSDIYTYAYNGVQVHAVSRIDLNGTTTFAFTYDNNGNMLQGIDLSDLTRVGTRQIVYGGNNMPVSIAHDLYGTTEFVYDGEDRRARKSSDAQTIFYIDRDFEIIDGEPVNYVFAGNRRIAKISSAGSFLVHQDHLGSSVLITNASGAIEPSETVDYTPFGRMRNVNQPSITGYKFTDQEIDVSTGLYNYDARLYDATLGRFTMPDTVVPDWYNSQSLNRYSYCRNNPLIFTDPDGHFPADFSDWGKGLPDPEPMSTRESEMLGEIADRSVKGAVDGGFTGAVGGSAAGGIPGAIEGLFGGALIGGATGAARSFYEMAREYSQEAHARQRSKDSDPRSKKDQVDTPAEEDKPADESADDPADAPGDGEPDEEDR